MNEQEWETWDSMAYFKGSTYMTAEDPGEPFIVIETLRGTDLPFQSGGFLGLDFEKGTPRETAKEIIELLNKHIAMVTFTGPKKPRWTHVPGRGERWDLIPTLWLGYCYGDLSEWS